jgi:hypothetical protein
MSYTECYLETIRVCKRTGKGHDGYETHKIEKVYCECAEGDHCKTTFYLESADDDNDHKCGCPCPCRGCEQCNCDECFMRGDGSDCNFNNGEPACCGSDYSDNDTEDDE